MEMITTSNYVDVKMEMITTSNYYSSMVGGVGVAVMFWELWSVLDWVWLTPKSVERHLKKQGFSGNSYRLLFGDLKDFSSSMQKMQSAPIGIDDDILPRVLHSDHTTVSTYAFRMEKLKNMLPAFHLSCSEIVTKWDEMISSESGSSEVDVWPHLQTMTSHVISRTAFSSNYEEGRKVFQLQTEQADLTIQMLSSIYISGSRFLPTKNNMRMKKIDTELKSALTSLINRRMKEISAGESGKTDDLLGILLESNMKETENNGNDKKAGMSISEVIDECKLFYFAGQETTSALLVWTLVLLRRHQNWQQRAREEVLEVFGNQEPTIDGLTHLKVVTIFLNEVLRLYPPVVIMGRTVHKETKVGKLSIPAGAILALPSILLQHDPEIWGDDVKEFKPERFSEGISKATKKQTPYIPFGWGPRVCIGQNFTMLEAKMAMAMILQRFSFEVSPSYTHAPYTVITLQPQYGAHLILHKL